MTRFLAVFTVVFALELGARPASAAAPIGDPPASMIFFECGVEDNSLLNTMSKSVPPDAIRLWITDVAEDPEHPKYTGTFRWWYSNSDLYVQSHYFREGDLFVFGRVQRQLTVGPDGNALYHIAEIDDEGRTDFHVLEMTCRKGDAFR